MATIDRGGARIHYQAAGHGPAVLLIQGVGLVGEGWRPQIEGLRDRFTLVAPDNRGIGRSVAPAGRLTIEDMATDALAVMDAMGAERFHLAGHSMGGIIAQEVALRAPARVRSLALLCTFARGSQGSKLTPALLIAAIRMRIGTRRMRRHAFLELVMPSAYLRGQDTDRLAEDLRPLFGHDLAEQPSIAMRQLRAMARYDSSGRLAALGGIPTLVVAASGDRIAVPAYGRALTAAIPGARYVEIGDAGHGVTIQRADEVNGLLASHFLAADGASSGAAISSAWL
ncbi:MAG TPA: alpha/beta fold hydrolase [Vicinamibacterales bacterium]|nr:alpha/beta fold hydrolase [Vicinamibacterales bacterium]